ncbi:TonB-dependent receptor plug domain-containing protein [Costertonia aggregata]|uniref:TonB-dependent receptor n=1 Tax=Costertonia aggregata TaxID=343403 RepID=A0A7H9AK95_9FLAO|nr:TonB-dependent receptor [Costertonia aggregata]QLG43919.1 TonB-dependent receptor [Costertonia aggregata]
MNKKLLGFSAMVMLCTKVVAQQQQQDSMKLQELDEVVVSDSRFVLKRENSGKTVVKITAQELERNQGRSIAEIINTKSGLEVNGSRSFSGQNISVFARGGNNRQVLVLVDGIQVSDPSNVNGQYDLRLLNTLQIQSIEIIKGAASTLYGNSAATAVINITTKKAPADGVAMEVLSSLGTNQSQNDQNYNISDFSNTVTVAGNTGKLSILASGGHQFTDGLSAAIGEEADVFSRIDGNLKLGYVFSDRFNVTATAFYNKLNTDFDNGFPVEDADFSFRSEQSRFGLSTEYIYEKGSVQIHTAFNQITRDTRSSFPTAFNSESFILDAFNKYIFNDKLYTIIGVNIIDHKTFFTDDQSINTIDPYGNVVYVSDFGLNINAGVRLNNHSEYGSNLIYNFNPSYRIKINGGYIKFLGSYATSFIAPNLSQLFGPFGANPDLEPEENTTVEGGIEYRPSDKFRLSALYFDRKEENFIDFVGPGYINTLEDRNASGLEIEFVGRLTEALQVSSNYTFTESKDRVILRLPKHKINADIAYTFSGKTYTSLSYQYVSERLDFGEVPLDAFSLFDFYLKHDVNDTLNFFVSVNNIFNTDYFEVLNFTTRGRNVRLGMRLKL